VFDETNGSQVEQVDLDELDDKEASCIALRNMSIGDVLEMAMGKYPPGITTPYPYPRHKNNLTGLPIYTSGYGFTPI
jgi:hypothetical protein